MQENTLSPTLSNFVDAANQFIGVVEDNRLADIRKPIDRLIEHLSLGLFRIVVMGEVKKGKTSFVGALLGEYDYLPVHHEVATSIVYKIIYGPQPAATVFFRPEDEGDAMAPQRITPGEIASYGTEDGNPGNKKNVDFIGIELPSPLLRQGLVIIDTPGLGSLYKRHREVTYRYVPKADAVFFVVDSIDSPMTQDEIDFLKELRQFTLRIYYVQTKADSAGQAQVEAWRVRNLDILSQSLGLPPDKITYFTVSSKLKQLADQSGALQTSTAHRERLDDLRFSGFPLIYRFLDHYLIPAKESLIAKAAMKSLRDLVRSEGIHLQERMKIVQQAGRDELTAKEIKLQETLDRLKKWQQGDFRDIERRFLQKVEDLKQDYRYSIQEYYDTNGVKFGERVESIKLQFRSTDQLGRKAEQILADYADESVQYGLGLTEKFLKKFASTYRESFNQKFRSYARDWKIKLQPLPAPHIDKGRIDDDAIKSGVIWGTAAGGLTISAFSAYFGANVGTAIITIGVGSLNPIGWVVAGTIVAASAAAGLHSYRKVKEQKQENALRKLELALGKVASQARQAIIKHFEDQSRIVERLAREGIIQFFDQTQTELNGRLDEIRRTKERSAESNRTALHQIGEAVAVLIRLDREIEAVLGNRVQPSDGKLEQPV